MEEITNIGTKFYQSSDDLETLQINRRKIREDNRCTTQRPVRVFIAEKRYNLWNNALDFLSEFQIPYDPLNRAWSHIFLAIKNADSQEGPIVISVTLYGDSRDLWNTPKIG